MCDWEVKSRSELADWSYILFKTKAELASILCIYFDRRQKFEQLNLLFDDQHPRAKL